MKIMLQTVGTCITPILSVVPIFHHLEHSGTRGI